MTTTTRQWLLNDHPRGRPIADNDLKLVTINLPAPAEGQMLLKSRWLGFDPAQKGWMENIADYIAPMNIGDVMRGTAITEVLESNDAPFPVGTLLTGMTGWTEYLLHDGKDLDLVEPSLPPTASLSVLGLSGLTAWCGLFKIGKPIAGDLVVVSGAAGATGSVVGQLAKIAGCTTIGIAGGPEKCAWLVNEAGFDHAIDYKDTHVKKQLRTLASEGANIVFDNVGGNILDDMLANIADGARVVVCGGISRYESGGRLAGPQNYFNLIFRRARMEGFIVLDWADEWPAIRKRMISLIQSGKLHWQEDVQHGFENAPATLRRLFTGANRGKQLLEL
jgi:NADPH-dependent curcumin reductase CurA